MNLSSSESFYVVSSTKSDLTDAMWAIERSKPHCVVRFLRGDFFARREGLFDEFAAALQFPYYFGNNWAAFEECISDLEWLNALDIQLVIWNADVASAKNAESFIRLVAALSNASVEFSLPIQGRGSVDRPAIGFTTFFHVSTPDAAEAIQVLIKNETGGPAKIAAVREKELFRGN